MRLKIIRKCSIFDLPYNVGEVVFVDNKTAINLIGTRKAESLDIKHLPARKMIENTEDYERR